MCVRSQFLNMIRHVSFINVPGIADAPLPLLSSGTCSEGQCTGLLANFLLSLLSSTFQAEDRTKKVHRDHILRVKPAVEQQLSCALPKNYG